MGADGSAMNRAEDVWLCEKWAELWPLAVPLRLNRAGRGA